MSASCAGKKDVTKMGKAAYLRTKKWRFARLKCFERDSWRCTRCGRSGKLECHHTTPLYKDPKQDAYDLNNLATLCRGCHIIVTREERKQDQAPNQYAELIAQL